MVEDISVRKVLWEDGESAGLVHMTQLVQMMYCEWYNEALSEYINVKSKM